MTQPPTIADVQAMVDDIDAELRKLRALIRHGEKLRAELAQALEALIAGNDP